MKYLYQNKYWQLNKDYNTDKLLYLMIDRPNKIIYNNFVWKNNKNQSHRDYDLPSSVYFYKKNGNNLYWEINNKYHRENDKPAHIRYDGFEQYYLNSKLIKYKIEKGKVVAYMYSRD